MTVALFLALLGGGCDQQPRESQSTGATARATEAKPPATATARPRTSVAAPHGLRAPEPKAYEAPEASKLGTLPPGVGIDVGQKAPDFELRDAEGKPIELSAVAADGTVLLVFYRGGW